MADVFTPAERSRVMRAVLSRDTQPELLVRRLAARLGFRTRVKSRKLPGSPDLVFTRLRKVVFVHGCFWHRHACPRGRSHPAARRAFWAEKFARNVRRDRAALRALRREGWQVLVIWECNLKSNRLNRTIDRLRRFLES
jgi:DNA mismatch endonuclease (patch repair protein)